MKETTKEGENFTIENEGIVGYGNDLINFKIVHDRDST